MDAVIGRLEPGISFTSFPFPPCPPPAASSFFPDRQVHGDEYFPADLILLSSSTAEGVAYIETMNLDGETNLKIKKGLEETWAFTEEGVHKFSGHVECEQPNNSLYTFTGNLLLADEAGRVETLSLSPMQVLLRGSSLRNTTYITGVVFFSGHDTKVMMNGTEAPSKRSRLERQLDSVVLFMFFTLIVMCIIGSVNVATLTKNNGVSMWYLASTDADVVDQYNPSKPDLVGLENFVTLLILYSYLIPISLYVSIEMVKLVQSMVFINMDRKMYHRETDTPALARTSNLNEELGMVDTVLSDKTGTLTCNVMEFFKARAHEGGRGEGGRGIAGFPDCCEASHSCSLFLTSPPPLPLPLFLSAPLPPQCSIAGVMYGTGSTEIERSLAERAGKPLGADSAEMKPLERGYNFRDKRLEVRGREGGGGARKRRGYFFFPAGTWLLMLLHVFSFCQPSVALYELPHAP